MSDTINIDSIKTGATSWYEYCFDRLPCGLCRRTNMPCPYYTNTMQITCEKTNDLPYTINYCGDVLSK